MFRTSLGNYCLPRSHRPHLPRGSTFWLLYILTLAKYFPPCGGCSLSRYPTIIYFHFHLLKISQESIQFLTRKRRELEFSLKMESGGFHGYRQLPHSSSGNEYIILWTKYPRSVFTFSLADFSKILCELLLSKGIIPISYLLHANECRNNLMFLYTSSFNYLVQSLYFLLGFVEFR